MDRNNALEYKFDFLLLLETRRYKNTCNSRLLIRFLRVFQNDVNPTLDFTSYEELDGVALKHTSNKNITPYMVP